MDGNVDQHRAFEPGLQQLIAYTRVYLAGDGDYDGSELLAIIDGFGAALVQHLEDEIPTFGMSRQ